MILAARLYHVHSLRQREIGERLGLSQARVSRLLRQAEELGIVRTQVVVPEGLHPELENDLEARYGLVEAHVVEIVPGPDSDLTAALGRATAHSLTGTIWGGGVVGFTSWSRTLQEVAHGLASQPRLGITHVVEMLGDLGEPRLQHAATRSTQAFASAVGAEPVFLRVPGISPSPALHAATLSDRHVRRALGLLDALDVAFVGIGPAAVHSGLRDGEGYFTMRQLAQVRRAGAVGQLNERFIDAAGGPVSTPLDSLVVGSSLQQIRSARRRVVVAGGTEKHQAIAAALSGQWIDVLVTDDRTARWLLRRKPGGAGVLRELVHSA